MPKRTEPVTQADPLADLLAQWRSLLPAGHDAAPTEAALRELPVELARERLSVAISRLRGIAR